MRFNMTPQIIARGLKHFSFSRAYLLVCAITGVTIGVLLFVGVRPVSAGNSCQSATSGNWSNSGTWTGCGGTTPTSADTVTILSPHTVTVNAGVGSATIVSLTVNNGATLTLGSTTTAITVSTTSDLTNNGTIQPNNPGSATAHNLQVGGNFTNNGTVNTVNGNGSIGVTFNGAGAQSISGSSATSFQNITIANSASSVSATTNLNVAGTMTINANATFNPSAAVVVNSSAANGTLAGSGTVKVTGATGTNDFFSQYKFSTYTLTNLTVDYAGATGQEVSAAAYGKLTISNSSANVTATSATGITVSGTMSVGANATFSPDATVVINSAAATGTISGSGTIKVSRIVATSDYSNQYKFSTNTLSSMTVDYSGAGGQTINSSAYGGVMTSGSGTKTLGGSVTVNNNVVIGSGTTLDETTRTMTLPGGATITVNGTLDFSSSTGLIQSGTSGTTTLIMGSTGVIRTLDGTGLGPAALASLQTQTGGSWNTTSIDTNGTVEYYQTGAQPVTDRNYNKLLITNTGTKTWALAADRTVNSDLTISTLAPLTLSGTQTVNIKGNWSNSGTFTAGTSTVNFNGAANQSIGGSSSTTFSTLTISNTGSTNNVVSLAKDTTVSTALNISSGVFDQGASFNLTTGTTTVSANATFRNLGTGDLTLSGGVSNAGTINLNANGSTCGDNDDILIKSSVTGTQRTWSGAGTFSLVDVDVKDQTSVVAPVITVSSGTNSGNNGATWVFVATCPAGQTYTWTGPTLGNDSYTTPANWTPVRFISNPADVLVFNTGFTPTVSGVPTETIARLQITNGTGVTMSTSAANTLTIGGGTGTDLDLVSSSQLTLSGASALTLSLSTGATGNIDGLIKLAGGAHRLLATDPAAITFPSGSSFTTDPTYSSSTNPFGTGTGSNNGSIIFASGSFYFHNNGASPFGSSSNNVVTFQTGSEADFLTSTGFEASGRTYATLIIGSSSTPVVISQSGTGSFKVDNLVITSTSSSQSSLTYDGSQSSSSSTITLQGSITSVGQGNNGTAPDLTLTAGTGGILIKVPSGGSVTYGNGLTAPAHGIDFESDATLDSGTTLNLGRKIQMGLSASKTLTVNGTLNPNVSAAGYIIGNVKKSFTGTGTKTFEVGTVNGYSQVDITDTAGTGTMTATAVQATRLGLTAAKTLKRYWTLTKSSASTDFKVDLTFHYLDPTDIAGTEANYHIVVIDSGVATYFPNQCPSGSACVDSSANTFTKKNQTSFSDWTASEDIQPTAVNLRSFAAVRSGDDVFIQWSSGYEVHNLGYNLYREQNGTRTLLTPAMIAGSALIARRDTELTAGGTYSWTDRLNGGGGNPAYWLEDVDLDGTVTAHGPIVPVESKTKFAGAQAGERQHSETFNDVADQRMSVLTDAWPAAQAQGLGVRGQGSAQERGSGVRAQGARQSETTSDVLRSTVTGQALSTQQAIAATDGVKIKVSRNGWYRVTQPELLAAGLAADAAAANLQLFVNAEQVPIKISSNGASLSPSDYIEFYGHGVDSTTDGGQTYYLIAGSSNGARIAAPVGGDLQTPSGPNSFAYTVEKKERGIYFSGLLNGDADNIFGRVVSSSGVLQTVASNKLDQLGAARLEIQLQGVSGGTHAVKVFFNNTDIGTLVYTNTEHLVQSLNVPSSSLIDGNNTIRLAAVGSGDISLIDKLRLTYAHTFIAENDSLFVGINSNATTRIGGFTNANVRAIDATDAANPRELATVATQQPDGTYSVDLQVAGASSTESHTLLVFVDQAVAHADSIVHNDPSSWNANTNRADYLIITSRDLSAAVQPLANYRRSSGMLVQTVNVEDLYDEYSFGLHSPYAVRDFLKAANDTWQRHPRYVLFVGDSSFDPKNFFNRGFNDIVPTKLIDTSQMETASDDWLADFNGDGIADLSIGRLPARTSADVAVMVNKIINFETSANDSSRGALLVADRTFEADATALQHVLPSSLPVQTINRSSSDDATIHNEIVSALNRGPRVVNYFGHGSNGVWTSAPLLSIADGPSLTNGNPSLFTMMTCFNGYFEDVFNDSLSEALLKAPGGAVGVWASTSLTEPPGQDVIAEEFYREIFSAQAPTLGDAVRNAKQLSSDSDIRRTWTLFADPAMSTIGQVAPTDSKSTISGTVTDNNGQPMGGVTVSLSGKQSRETITDANGNYSFADADANGYYNVTPARANFSFSPVTRSFTLSGVHTAESFVGTANGAALNPLDTDSFFVRQHYLDFLNREPDESGFNFWTNEIASCGADDRCREVKRINISAAYFLSIEFQQTGFEVYRLYKSAYGNLPNAPVPVRFAEFTSDTHDIANGVVVGRTNWEATLEANKAAFAQQFVQRSRFAVQYPTSMTPGELVDALFGRAGVTPSSDERTAAVNEFAAAADSGDAAARGRALRRVAENPRLAQQEFNRAFVLMQYFGYLRRDPNASPDTDYSGYTFWLNKLNGFNGNYIDAEMVKAFLSSVEYRRRFGN